MTEKKGMSTIYVIISILIVLIGLAIVIIMMMSNNLKLQTESLSKELMKIQSNIKKLEVAKSDLPVDELVVYDQKTLLTLLSKNRQVSLAAEIKDNKDEDARFLVIDMTKLGTIESSRGSKELGGEDIFVVAEPSLRVYYVGGVHIDGQSYYSLTKRLAKNTKFDEDDKLIEFAGNFTNNLDDPNYSVTSENKSWTNALSIKISTLIGKNIKMIMNIAGKDIDITNEILDKKYTLKVTDDITEEMIENSNSVVIKKVDLNGRVLEQETVDISNVDIIPPVLSIEGDYFKVEQKSTYNLVTITPKDDKSGVDYIICEYIKKKDNKGQIVNVKETSIIDKEEIKANLIKTGEKNKSGIIKVPIYISEFRVLAVDKAGNVSEYLEVKIPDAYVSNEAF